MVNLKSVLSLGPVDLYSVRRDPLLRMILIVPVILVAAMRLLIPFLTDWLTAQFRFDLRPYYMLIASFMAITLPLLYGMIIGFLLLDQKDDRTLSALQVTPLSLDGYLVYRVSMPVIISFLVVIIALPLMGLVQMSLGSLLLVAFESALMAPMVALLLANIAENKVQGFALSKAEGIFLIPPLAAYFVQGNWQWLFGLVPTYWPVKLFWMFANGEPGILPVFLIGLVYQAIIVWVLMRTIHKMAI